MADSSLPAGASLNLELDGEGVDEFSPAENTPARLGRWAAQAIVVVLILMMGAEMIARSVFHWSIQISNEIGGYGLAAITFLSLASGQMEHAYHRVHLLEHRLGNVGRARLRLGFDIATLLVTAVLLAEFVRFEWITFKSGDVAATSLMTPQWMPRVVMPIGAFILAWALAATVRGDWRRLQAARANPQEQAMGGEYQIIFIFILFIALLTAGMTVPFAILLPGVVYLYWQGGIGALHGLGLASWGSMDSYTLTAIPLFVLMAEVLQGSGLGLRVYGGLSKLVRKVPGGLLQTNIAGCAVFAAVCGSSVATAASIGKVALPQLKARGYDPKLATGSLAAGGTLGILLPPSIAMIVYASFTETSVAKLFMAGVVPGIVLTLMFMAYVAVAALIRPEIAPKETGRLSRAEPLRALIDVVPFVLLIAGIMGAIYTGVATPTEAAAAGCLFALLIANIFGELSWREFMGCLKRSTIAVSNILFITYAAFVFSYAMSVAGVGEEITQFIIGLNLNKIEFFLALLVLFTGLGALVESLGMIVITVPLLYPLLSNYGIDPVWFGIVVVLFIEMGQITPPIGINLFVIQSIARGKLSDVVMGTIPFHLIMFVLLGLLVAWPQIALWLPGRVGG